MNPPKGTAEQCLLGAVLFKAEEGEPQGCHSPDSSPRGLRSTDVLSGIKNVIESGL